MRRPNNVALVVAFIAAACQPAADFPDTSGDSVVIGPPPPVPSPPAATTETVARDSAPIPAAPAPVDTPPPAITPVATDTVPRVVPVEPAEDEPPTCTVPPPVATPGTLLVTVYFTCGGEERAVRRRVEQTQGVLRAALSELLRGPTDGERAAGFRSFFSAETTGKLNYVAVGSDGVARIDFDDFSQLIPNASSSAGSEQLLGQLRETILQYPTVRAASISFNGDCDAFWNWLQRDCQRLTR